MLTSRSNATIKQIRALRHRKEREQTGLYWLEGLRLVGEAVDLHAPLQKVIVAPELLKREYGEQLLATAQERAIEIIEVSADVFQSLSTKDGPQGLGAVLEQRWTPLNELSADQHLGWIALYQISDPGNLGTILRTADAVGFQGVILVDNCTDAYDPHTVRASMGALLSQTITRTTWPEFSAWVGQHHYTLVGAADNAAVQYQTLQYQRPTVLFMGSEREGLSQAHQAACDAIVHIPMVGRSDSLNLAIATSVIAYEIFNQQQLA